MGSSETTERKDKQDAAVRFFVRLVVDERYRNQFNGSDEAGKKKMLEDIPQFSALSKELEDALLTLTKCNVSQDATRDASDVLAGHLFKNQQSSKTATKAILKNVDKYLEKNENDE